MKRSLLKRSIVAPLQIAFALILAAVSIGLLFVHPKAVTASGGTDARSRCEAKGDWWDDQDKVCAVPVPLSTLTGQPAKTR